MSRITVTAFAVLLAASASSQTIQTLPPIAGPPRNVPRAAPPEPPSAEPYRPDYRSKLPPPVPVPQETYRRQSTPMPPAPSAQELHARDEPLRLRWRTAIAAEFAEWWGRYQCFPHPRRQNAWFEMLRDRLSARTDQQMHVLYGLVMERVELYGAPRTQFSGLLGDAEEWVNGFMHRRAPDDPFCPPG
jgi:hypothetical protein